jgi:hypothetical protein
MFFLGKDQWSLVAENNQIRVSQEAVGCLVVLAKHDVQFEADTVSPSKCGSQ